MARFHRLVARMALALLIEPGSLVQQALRNWIKNLIVYLLMRNTRRRTLKLRSGFV